MAARSRLGFGVAWIWARCKISVSRRPKLPRGLVRESQRARTASVTVVADSKAEIPAITSSTRDIGKLFNFAVSLSELRHGDITRKVSQDGIHSMVRDHRSGRRAFAYVVPGALDALFERSPTLATGGGYPLPVFQLAAGEIGPMSFYLNPCFARPLAESDFTKIWKNNRVRAAETRGCLPG